MRETSVTVVRDGTNDSLADAATAESGVSPKFSELMKAREALDMLSPILGGPAAAKELIIDQLSRGKLQAFASRQWQARGVDVELLWERGPTADATKREKITRKLFRPTAGLVDDSKGWNWARGRFFVTVQRRPMTRHMMQTVRFVPEDVTAIAKAYGGKVGRGGRPTNTDAWTQFWLEVVRMTAAGDLTKDKLINREAFKCEVFHRLGWDQARWDGKPPLALTTLRGVTGKIWDEFIEPRPNRRLYLPDNATMST